MDKRGMILSYLGGEPERILSALPPEFWDRLQELRIRVDKPLIAVRNSRESFVTPAAELSSNQGAAYKPTASDIEKTVSLISNFSLYAFDEELRNGYITIAGGHRVGISGRAVVENAVIKTIRNINGLNFRIAHEVKGCADGIMNFIYNGAVCDTMIISPPCCGKTTLLRDIIRQLSNLGQAVSVVDERSEIAGCYRGIPQNDVGIRTDVLDGGTKAEGMLMLLRAMSPKVIAVDEIGRAADVRAIEEVVCAGARVICSVHGQSISEVKNRQHVSELLGRNLFKRFVVLNAPGIVGGVYDENYKKLG